MAFYIYDEEKQLPEVILLGDGTENSTDGTHDELDDEPKESFVPTQNERKKPFPSSVFAVQCFFSALLILVVVIIKWTNTLPPDSASAMAQSISHGASFSELNEQLWSIIEESELLSYAFNTPSDATAVYKDIIVPTKKIEAFSVSYGIHGWQTAEKDYFSPYIPAARISALGTLKKHTPSYAFIAPVMGRISSPFGDRIDPIDGKTAFHKGIDIAAPSGTAICAVATGFISSVGQTESYGNCVTVAHSGGYYSFYAHCQKILVSEGDTVSQGDIIALVGSTGKSTGNHLHFELRHDGIYVDPLDFFTIP